MSSVKKKKSNRVADFKDEESPQKNPPLRQSPRKKMRENKLDILLAASQMVDGGGKLPVQEEPEDDKELDEEEETTTNDIPASKSKTSTKFNMKLVQAQSSLDLETVKQIPKKMLPELFSERLPDKNQYTNHFTFRCSFFTDPDRCSMLFHGYRDEGVVQGKVEEHLNKHIMELDNAKDESFQTTSIQFRKRQADNKKKKKGSSPPTSRKSGKFTALKSNSPDPELSQVDQNSNHSSDSKSSHSRKRKQPAANKENKPAISRTSTTEGPAQKKMKASSSSQEQMESNEDSLDSDPVQKDQEQQVNLTQMLYPDHDHSYALLPGEPLKSEEEDSSPSESGSNSLSVGISIKTDDAAAESSGTAITLDCFPMAVHEETIQATTVPETAVKNVASTEESGNISTSCDAGARKRKLLVLRKKVAPIPEERKKSALTYIRELKSRKKDEKIPLVCKICNDGKVFTAGATLLNHYKSHAGVKSFTCKMCKSTFTRRHSLNYHMMIHQGESRFTCEVCFREFRHPSHFKEHKRKHTGETPYECRDCSARFKTRNTYKRHLMTRHGKLLSAEGITLMSAAEFAKVRTKKYKKSNESSPEHEQSSQEPIPGPSQASPEPPSVEPKRLRKVKTPAPPSNSSVVAPPITSAMPAPAVTSTVTLPPVSTILPPFATHGQAGPGTMKQVVPQSVVHVNPGQVVVGTVSQASVGVMPPLGAVQTNAAAVGSLGMAMMAPAVVSTPAGMATPSSMSVVPQAWNMAQPAVTIDPNNMQGQTFYTITTLSPVVPMEPAAQSVYQPVPPPLQQHTDIGHIPEVDMAEYKPVGYVTHP